MSLTQLEIDDYDLPAFLDVARCWPSDRYGYVVTPNADHLIRLDEEPAFRLLYRDAGFVLLDSRFLARMIALGGGPRLPVCAGSDLTAALFESVIAADDPLVLIGGDRGQADALAARYGLTRLAHHNPPMGFIRDAAAVEAALTFVEAHSPFRFCLLGVGAPQQEMLAQMLLARGRAAGLALCIGASVNFLTGVERRAPVWLQRLGLEWLFRLLQSPRRLAHRYLVRNPKVFALLRRVRITLRPRRSLRPADAPPPAAR